MVIESTEEYEPIEEYQEDHDGEINYWWLNANPKIWNFNDLSIGEKQTYTSYNEKGNKRQIYTSFQEVKLGDIILGYVTSPQKEIVAICKITQGLHDSEEGEVIKFEKIEQLRNPISFRELQDVPELQNCRPIVNNQGSLFPVMSEEYEIIRAIIDENNPPIESISVHPFSKEDALADLFLDEETFDEILARLKYKKNVILQGPPGVGKSFIAKRLAYTFIGFKDDEKVEMIQFHQAYSYEDFIQGFRPNEDGKFSLKNGVFYNFCKKAQRDVEHPYVFIIDEINRGNLSKIFGELMLLIEPDKRGKKFAMPLTYSESSDEKLYIPDNVHVIGMMNTADRSLAMVDYALRRRFSFVNLEPQFSSPKFTQFLFEKGVEEVLIEKIITRITKVNEQITQDHNLGWGYCIGHSFFCPNETTGQHGNAWYQQVIIYEIAPLVREYWFDDSDKADAIIKSLRAL